MEIERIRKIVEEILDILTVEYTIDVVEDTDLNTKRIAVHVTQPQILIGKEGKTLMALNYIVKRIAEKQCREGEKLPYFILDINNYQDRLVNELKTQAHMFAERARYFKKSVEMNPVSPYERMMVHAMFTTSPDIETASTGEGVDRRIVFSYKVVSKA